MFPRLVGLLVLALTVGAQSGAVNAGGKTSAKRWQTVKEVTRAARRGFRDWQSQGHVEVKEKGDLLLFRYTHAAQVVARWTFFERISRGLIINRRSGEVVARPYDKFFNWGQGGRTSGAKLIATTEKLDGLLGNLYRAPDHRIATTGSFDGHAATWATGELGRYPRLGRLPQRLTLAFEIIHPMHRIVLDYGRRAELILLGARDRFTGRQLPHFEVEQLALDFELSRPKTLPFGRIEDVVAAAAALPPDHEGFVVEFADGQRFKVKGEAYNARKRSLRGDANVPRSQATAASHSSTVPAARSNRVRPPNGNARLRLWP